MRRRQPAGQHHPVGDPARQTQHLLTGRRDIDRDILFGLEIHSRAGQLHEFPLIGYRFPGPERAQRLDKLANGPDRLHRLDPRFLQEQRIADPDRDTGMG